MLAFRKKSEVTASQLRKHAREILRYRKRVCANCNYSEHVEACHVKSVSSFSAETLLLEINDPSNLVFLCPNCHKQLDGGHLRFEPRWTNNYSEDEEEAVL